MKKQGRLDALPVILLVLGLVAVVVFAAENVPDSAQQVLPETSMEEEPVPEIPLEESPSTAPQEESPIVSPDEESPIEEISPPIEEIPLIPETPEEPPVPVEPPTPEPVALSGFAAEFAARNERGLSSRVAGKSVLDDEYAQEYLNHNDYFPDVAFDNLDGVALKPYAVQVGNNEKKPTGIQKGAERYVIDVIACSEEFSACWMRINGVIFKRFTKEETIQLDDMTALRITDIKFGQCGGQQFCDYYYEAYHEVEMEIVQR